MRVDREHRTVFRPPSSKACPERRRKRFQAIQTDSSRDAGSIDNSGVKRNRSQNSIYGTVAHSRIVDGSRVACGRRRGRGQPRCLPGEWASYWWLPTAAWTSARWPTRTTRTHLFTAPTVLFR